MLLPMAQRVLVVEDEADIAFPLVRTLEREGYDVAWVANGEDALASLAKDPAEVVILDLGLPDVDGIEVIQGLRGWSRVPIVVLSAREGQPDKVAALDAGADDYLTKPFGMDELLARIRAALRRAQPEDSQPVITTERFTLDLAAKRVSTREGPVRLTPTEWHLLEILAKNAGKLVSRQQLLTEVWGPAYARETNYLRVYMAQIRQKLEVDPSHPRYVITEPGMGYRFEP